ncbi:MAG: thiosulfate oxidation carrier complex protein SoxZ [Azospirillum sp.]|nr:thiosulfate oxidation carrier complex protein SoxZ [Azospirillum sp.]
MSTAVKPRVKAPAKASKGEIFEVKTLVNHEMESGQRKDRQGAVIPRKIIKKFTARYNGRVVFSCDWYPSISSNPYLAFNIKADESGTIQYVWEDDDGTLYEAESKLAVN